jgi:prepilin-type N-terminal cleavage/methylation domain-containing protein
MRRNGFTLIELLVVLLIVAIVSAATLPTLVPAISHRQVSEASRLIQATIEGARDASVRANAPRGIRLLPDPAFPGSATDAAVPLAYNRLIAIEPAPDYSEGLAVVRGLPSDPPSHAGGKALRVEESQKDAAGLPVARTSWYWNVRLGDRIRFGQTGRYYTVAGPMVIANAERFTNAGEPGTLVTNPNEPGSEYLFLVNGADDDGDGYADEGFDGLDQDGDGTADDADEWEQESWTGPAPDVVSAYTIARRPVPSPGTRVTELPADVVIDATTWKTTRERSRLPVDPVDLSCEIMVDPNGTIRAGTPYGVPSADDVAPFFHAWLAERGDVHPAEGTAASRLPMPEGTPGYSGSRLLRGERRLVTVHARSGAVVTTGGEPFDGADVNAPFYAAQMGRRDAP